MNAPPPPPAERAAPGRSLRWRLLAATTVALLVALGLAGWLLSELFRSHVMRQSVAMLTAQIDQVTARLVFTADGRPDIDPGTLSDPRWSRPQSGLYWQVDGEGGGPSARGVLRSRSLWDATLTLPADELVDGEVHVHELSGPRGEPLLAVERTVRDRRGSAGRAAGGGSGSAEGGDPRSDPGRSAGTDATADARTHAGRGAGGAAARWRIVVAADLAETQAAIGHFDGVLAASLAGLLLLLGAAGWAQVTVGLAPLRALQRAVAALHDGRASRLEGAVPAEVQPLVDDFNAVLKRNAELVERARTQAGNLAHALKTPLAVLRQAALAAARGGPAAAELPALVGEQVSRAQRQVDVHLARARAAAAHGLPGARVAVRPLLTGLVRVMEKVHAGRGIVIAGPTGDEDCAFEGDAEDLHEIVGNVLDNACKWAQHEVRVTARFHAGGAPASVRAGTAPARIEIRVHDDGPGIAEPQRAAVLGRGTRLDESVPGSGLGLSIARELVDSYGGTLEFLDEPAAGLHVRILLPGAATAPAGRAPAGLFSPASGS